MPEWTLCADQKVYARLRAVAKPTTRPVAHSEEFRHHEIRMVTYVT
ncbi:hypothetical protein ABGB16_03820 [Micromonospora sp. B11E3]